MVNASKNFQLDWEGAELPEAPSAPETLAWIGRQWYDRGQVRLLEDSARKALAASDKATVQARLERAFVAFER